MSTDWRAHLRDRDGLELGAILSSLKGAQEIVHKALADKNRPDWLEVADLYDNTSDRIAEIEHVMEIEAARQPVKRIHAYEDMTEEQPNPIAAE